MRQTIELLQGDRRAGDFLELTLELGSWMVHLGGKSRTPAEARILLEGLIRDGVALAKLRQIVDHQGGDPRVLDDPGLLPKAAASRALSSPRSGFLSRLDARKIGEAAVLLGAGRAFMEQAIDYGAGILLEKKLGDQVLKGQTVATLYGSDDDKLRRAEGIVLSAMNIVPRAPKLKPLIRKVLK